MTRARTVNGIVIRGADFKQTKITLRTTSDEKGESLSLCSEEDEVLLIIPLEKVRDMVRLTRKNK